VRNTNIAGATFVFVDAPPTHSSTDSPTAVAPSILGYIRWWGARLLLRGAGPLLLLTSSCSSHCAQVVVCWHHQESTHWCVPLVEHWQLECRLGEHTKKLLPYSPLLALSRLARASNSTRSAAVLPLSSCTRHDDRAGCAETAAGIVRP
jgi:hypothetical protein